MEDNEEEKDKVGEGEEALDFPCQLLAGLHWTLFKLLQRAWSWRNWTSVFKADVDGEYCKIADNYPSEQQDWHG